MTKYLLVKRTDSQIDIFSLKEDGSQRYETTCYWKDDKSQSDAEGLYRVAMACEQISTYGDYAGDMIRPNGAGKATSAL